MAPKENQQQKNTGQEEPTNSQQAFGLDPANDRSYGNTGDSSPGYSLDTAGLDGKTVESGQDFSLADTGTGASDRQDATSRRSSRGPGGYSGIADDPGLGGATGTANEIGMHIENTLQDNSKGGRQGE